MFASGKRYEEMVGNCVMSRRSESARSATADAFDRDACARNRKRARAKGFGRGEGSVGGIGDDRKVWNRLVIKFWVVMVVLTMSFDCGANRYSTSSSCDRDLVGSVASPRASENRGSRHSKGREMMKSPEGGNSCGLVSLVGYWLGFPR